MRRVMIAVTFAAAGLVAAPAEAQLSRSTCADCHFARPESPAQDHLINWDRSPHARNGIGCDKCHGGNSATFEILAAHSGVLDSVSPKSPVNRRNLPTTCGGCHVGPFVAFQDSRHYELLESGKPDGPTCSTCHETVAGRLLSAKALEARCASCHGPGEVAPRADRARRAREIYERIRTIRADLKVAQSRIKKVRDPGDRVRLLDAYGQAEVPLIRAVNAGHRFVYDELEEYAAIAERRVQALLGTITVQPASR